MQPLIDQANALDGTDTDRLKVFLRYISELDSLSDALPNWKTSMGCSAN